MMRFVLGKKTKLYNLSFSPSSLSLSLSLSFSIDLSLSLLTLQVSGSGMFHVRIPSPGILARTTVLKSVRPEISGNVIDISF